MRRTLSTLLGEAVVAQDSDLNATNQPCRSRLSAQSMTVRARGQPVIMTRLQLITRCQSAYYFTAHFNEVIYMVALAQQEWRPRRVPPVRTAIGATSSSIALRPIECAIRSPRPGQLPALSLRSARVPSLTVGACAYVRPLQSQSGAERRRTGMCRPSLKSALMFD